MPLPGDEDDEADSTQSLTSVGMFLLLLTILFLAILRFAHTEEERAFGVKLFQEKPIEESR